MNYTLKTMPGNQPPNHQFAHPLYSLLSPLQQFAICQHMKLDDTM